MPFFKPKPNRALDQLLTTVPSEMLYEIFINLPFEELLNIFTLNREIYNLLIESEYFFEKLCKICCKLNDIDESDYAKAIEIVKKENNFKNLYRSVMIELITYGYKWDTQFQYYKTDEKYELTPKTLTTISKPSHGDFYTLKANRLLNPGKFYKWRIKLDSYNPGAVGNSFKLMIGMESLNFFPFNNQSSGDVVGWQSESKGIALIIGTREIIQASCSSRHPSQKLNATFETGDIIQIEFDFQNIPKYTPEKSTQDKYSNVQDDTKYMGLVRYSLIRDGELEELKSWIPFGDARFAPFVPAVSANMGQTISFV